MTQPSILTDYRIALKRFQFNHSQGMILILPLRYRYFYLRFDTFLSYGRVSRREIVPCIPRSRIEPMDRVKGAYLWSPVCCLDSSERANESPRFLDRTNHRSESSCSISAILLLVDRLFSFSAIFPFLENEIFKYIKRMCKLYKVKG